MPRVRKDKRAQLEEELRKLNAEDRWALTTKMWLDVRNSIPPEVMEHVSAFQSRFLQEASDRNLTLPQMIVAASFIFAPVVHDHILHRPANIEEGQWITAVYEAIQDSIIVAHALFNAVDEGRVIADEETHTLRARTLN